MRIFFNKFIVNPLISLHFPSADSTSCAPNTVFLIQGRKSVFIDQLKLCVDFQLHRSWRLLTPTLFKVNCIFEYLYNGKYVLYKKVADHNCMSGQVSWRRAFFALSARVIRESASWTKPMGLLQVHMS